VIARNRAREERNKANRKESQGSKKFIPLKGIKKDRISTLK